MILWNIITIALILAAAVWLGRKGWPRVFFTLNPVNGLALWLTASIALHVIG